ncbi:DNA mismatch repair protein MSH3 [Mycena belliarum]|uniref:DNA mismatch repair protein MSH3 n=1 Tax=Mycena belliarum TaxID=1033014 RepID=A0AAD6UII1_9AGAR|nr:DNA mismatch repair protein MSH3 [Mycena belliae]
MASQPTPSASPTRQARISTFFSPPNIAAKRPGNPQSPSRASPEPPLKKHKSGLPRNGQPVPSSSSKADLWRFGSNTGKAVPNTDVLATRAAFETKLLPGKTTPNNSKAPDQPLGVNSTPHDGDPDNAFTELSKFFSSRSGSEKVKKPLRKAKPVEEIGPSGERFTALEKQILRLKKENPDTVLMVEVGYRYKFFGEDAKIAAKELGMISFTDRNFLVASIPVPRRDIHLKKLLSQNYKVGIVNQVETAALKKAGDTRNEVFERKLVHLFTAATYVDGLDSIDELDKYAPPRLVCIIEEEGGKESAADVCIGMISVCASVGDVVWDIFNDSPMRIELETRLAHSKPTELLIPRNNLSKMSEKMLKHFTEAPASSPGIRVEYFDEAMRFSEAFEQLSLFYARSSEQDSKNPINSPSIAAITDLPKSVVIALAHTIKYLKTFDIAATLAQTAFFTKFTTRSHMLLARNTLANLEIFQNETDYTTTGSLMWILDKTVTAGGARLLREWVGRPLVDKCALELRIEAVEEILTSSSDKLVSLRQLLKGLPDLGKGLCRLQYKQSTPQEITVVLSAFYKIGKTYQAFQTPDEFGFRSKLLNVIFSSLPPLKTPMLKLLDAIDIKEAAAGQKDRMWKDPIKYPTLEDHKFAIRTVEAEIEQELPAIRRTLNLPSLKWTSALGAEYLIEVKRSNKIPIPDSWLPAVSTTKQIARYHSPEVKAKLQERARWQESLQVQARKAFLDFLDEAVVHYAIMRDATNKLATADCLLSLAHVALRDNYVKPQFTDDDDNSDTLEIIDGRHPMVEALRPDPFVPNTILFTCEGRSKVITGPNMGGKSSCVRMVALLAIMAQIGSYVPATAFKLGILDSVLTRMGAHDDIARGRSTFMVEMSETGDCLRNATRKSLVILDELGRGTSTFDGMAIAYAVLNHLVVSTQCKTLFITHYPLIAAELGKKFVHRLQNIHVGYHTERRGIDGRRDVTFLYQLTDGIAPESFGVECARLAGLPESILENARERSTRMEISVASRTRRNTSVKALRLMKDVTKQDLPLGAAATVEKLRTLVSAHEANLV